MNIADIAVDRVSWEHAQAEHLTAEKAHTRAGDALAAARRRLPATRVGAVRLVGTDGEVPLVHAFEGRRQLVTYSFMWHHGMAPHSQCEGCTFSISQVSDGMRAYLAERDVTFAILSEGTWDELTAYREFMGWEMPWYSVERALDNPAVAYGGLLRSFIRDGDDVYLTWETAARGTEVLDTANGLLDRTLLGRQERWEDSPDGWPQFPTGEWWRRDGRPVAQWLRTDEPVPQTDPAPHFHPVPHTPESPDTPTTKEPS